MATVRVGDTVKFLNAEGGGIVARIEKGLAYVEDEDGFQMPTPTNELIVVELSSAAQPQITTVAHPQAKLAGKPNTPQKGGVGQKAAQQIRATEMGATPMGDPKFLVCFLKGERGDSVELYAVNDSAQECFFVLCRVSADRRNANPMHRGTIPPHGKFHLGDYAPQAIDEQIWDCQVLFYGAAAGYFPAPPAHRQIKIKSTKFFKDNSFAPSPYFAKKAISHDITSDMFERSVEALAEADIARHQTTAQPTNKSRKLPLDQIVEVDLHIEAIVESTIGMSNGEMLELQLGRMEHVMREYCDQKGRRIVFIHGVGNGTLKREVLKKLSRNYPKCQTQDASFKEYGYGATLVTVR